MKKKVVLLIFVSVLVLSAVPETQLMGKGVDITNPRDSTVVTEVGNSINYEQYHVQIAGLDYKPFINEGQIWNLSVTVHNFDAGFFGASIYLRYFLYDYDGSLQGSWNTSEDYVRRDADFTFPIVSITAGSTMLPTGKDAVRIELWWNDYGEHKLQDRTGFIVEVCGETAVFAEKKWFNLGETFKEGSASTRAIEVPLDYSTIQEAINAANPGDTVFVHNGTYHEELIVNKTVSLVGENPLATTIARPIGPPPEMILDVLSVTADGCVITGFTIRGSSQCGIDIDSDNNTVTGNIVSSHFRGIVVVSNSNNVTDNVVIFSAGPSIDVVCSHNIIRENRVLLQIFASGDGGAITLGHSAGLSTNNTIANNTIISNYIYWGNGADGHDIYVYDSHGNTIKDNILESDIHLFVSNDNVFARNSIICNLELELSDNNLFLNNSFRGRSWLDQSDANVFDSNVIKGDMSISSEGYYLRSSNNNTIVRNTVTNVYTLISLENSNYTIIHHNNFINYTKQVGFVYGYSTVWDNGYPSGGNYWSDQDHGDCADHYGGPSQDILGSDGIVDDPYVIDANNRDRYPLMNPWPCQITPPSPPVGGIYISVNKLELLAPYIGLVLTMISAMVAITVFIKLKKRKR